MGIFISPDAQAQSFAITEFMAVNTTGERDEDAEFSDWIEIHNLEPRSASIKGWYLTDDPSLLTKWQFPDVSIQGGAAIIVFASGKDRRLPSSRLHTNFKLDSKGEYLALVKPDGLTIANDYGPKYPPQTANVSYGRVMVTTTNLWVASRASGKLLVPIDAALGQTWVQSSFDDRSWRTVVQGIGYYRPQDIEAFPEPGLPLEDLSRSTDLVIPTSSNSPASEGVNNAIDNSSSTKYLNFDKLNAGLTVTLGAGKGVVVGLRLTSANDAPDRDPTSYILSGSNDGAQWSEISRGPIPDFPQRFYPVTVSFTNKVAYSQFRLIFPTVKSPASAVAMQIAEVEFLGMAADNSLGITDFINTSIESDLYGKSSALVRFPFVVDSPTTGGALTLQMRYEDGFVAYLNGTEVARANAPASPAYNSLSLTNRYRYLASRIEKWDLGNDDSRLRSGTNVLAIQGFNDKTNSMDFLLEAQLQSTQSSLAEAAYFAVPTPGSLNAQPSLGIIAPVEPSPNRGFLDSPTYLVLSCPTTGAAIRYTTNGAVPTPDSGLLYAGPVKLDHTVTIRAAAFLDKWIPCSPITHTYIFVDDVVKQTQTSALAAGFPTNWGSQLADYGLDPRVVGPPETNQYSGKYTASLKDDLKSIPTMSIVMDPQDMFGPQGLYSNPQMRGSSWERPGSIELIYPDYRTGFQENAGFRVQGGAFRGFNLTLKKSFRVVFRQVYGASTLHYPLFGPDASDRLDSFTLRAGSNDAWPYDGAGALYIRDAFAMETARQMGMLSSHYTFVHLYINGQYWGLYNPIERPDAAFGATYLGGDKDDWDTINQDTVSNGSRAAWDRLFGLLNLDMSNNANYQRVQGNNPDGTRNPAYENLLNIPSLVDYMLLNFYVGNTDWPVRNWWVGRNRLDGDGFHFFPWDSETALDISGLDANTMGAQDAVARPYAAVRTNADFRMQFADRVYDCFFNDGPMWVNPTNSAWNPSRPENNRPAQRFAVLADQVSRAIVAESARWGDQFGTGPLTRDEHWKPRRDSVLTSYFPQRSARVLAQFRRAGLYPQTDPPQMNERGGSVPAGFQLVLTAPQGTIYYTTNGSDPRVPVTATPSSLALKYTGPVIISDLLTVKARVLNGTEWSALNTATFIVGKPELVISELNFNPGAPTARETSLGYFDPSSFEFIELHNPGLGSFDLSGAQFINGIHFSFTNSPVRSLSAGDYLVIVKNRAAFVARYGTNATIAGEFSGQLDNGGERITLVDRDGTALIDFTYETDAEWPMMANGMGATLEPINPAGNLNIPVNWHASAFDGGSPGAPNPVPQARLELVTIPGGPRELQFEGRGGSEYTVLTAPQLSTNSDSWQILQKFNRLNQDQPISVALPSSNTEIARFYRVIAQ